MDLMQDIIAALKLTSSVLFFPKVPRKELLKLPTDYWPTV